LVSPRKPINLLLIEDRPSDAKLVVRQLTKSGLDFAWRRVSTQRDLEAELEKPVDVILCDFHMPGFDVRRALQIAKARLPDTPFIVVSGTMNEGNGVEMMKLGADDYLLKDRLERLNSALGQALERIRQRRERRELEERYRSIVENLPGFVYTCSVDQAGTTTYVSHQVEAMLGVSPADYLADPEAWVKSIHPDDRDRVTDLFYTSVGAGEKFDSEYRVVARDGSVRWVRDQAVVLKDDKGRPSIAQGVTLDVTERRLAEQALLENQAKNRFLANMSHELRNPLNSVIGFAELLTSRELAGLSERQVRYISHIETAGQHLLSLVNDLLDLSKVVAGLMPVHVEVCTLDDVIEDCLGQLQPQATEREVYLAESGTDGLKVHADRQRLLQILINLVSNGIKFTPAGGTVEVSRRPEGGCVRVDVADTGPGIPKDKLEFIFEEFAQLDPTDPEAPKGTGLGLTLSRRLAELMKGTLFVTSTLGEGSTFTLSMPNAQAD
jgi:PAS domain S-box-containing protein